MHVLAISWDGDLLAPIDEMMDELNGGFESLLNARRAAVFAMSMLSGERVRSTPTALDAQALYEVYGADSFLGAAKKMIEKASDWKHMEGEGENLTYATAERELTDEQEDVIRSVLAFVTEGLLTEAVDIRHTRDQVFDKWERPFDYERRHDA